MPPGSAGSSKGKDLKLVVVGSGGESAWESTAPVDANVRRWQECDNYKIRHISVL